LKKSHLVEFSDDLAKVTGTKHDSIFISCAGDEKLNRSEVNGVPFISGNSDGLVKLGELLIQLGLSDYGSGFHLHIHKDFDSDKDEVLIIGVDRFA